MSTILKSVNILVRDRHGRALLQMRDGRAKSQPLVWSFWGGAVLPEDKTSAHTAAREFQEELGIRAEPDDFELVAERRSSSQMSHLLLYRNPVDWPQINILEGAGAAFFWADEITRVPASNAVRYHLSHHPTLFASFIA